MGLLDLPGPLLATIDGWLAGWLPAGLRLGLWGLIGSVLSMGLYALLAPQARLKELGRKVARAKAAMDGYDGEFTGVLGLAGNLLGLSLKKVGLTFFPAVIGSLPVLVMLVWMSTSYSLALPENGLVKGKISPPEAKISPPAKARPGPGQGVWVIDWRAATTGLEVKSPEGRIWARIETAALVPIVHKKEWWNFLIGNPAGYVAHEAPIETIGFEFREVEYLDFGPSWLRGWEVLFLLSVLVFSIIIKVFFKIQ